MPSLIERAWGMLFSPKQTWRDIREEETTIRDLYRSYAAPMALIPPVATVIGMSWIGMSFMGFHYRTAWGAALVNAVFSYGLSLLGLYLIAWIIDALAPRFQSRPNRVNALKVVVYSSTPSWVAGIVFVWPLLSPLAVLLSLYSFYLLYLGLPLLMDTPREKALLYTIAAIGVSILIFIVAGGLANAVFGSLGSGHHG